MKFYFFESLAEIGTIAMENAKMYKSIMKNYENVMNDIFTLIGYRRSI